MYFLMSIKPQYADLILEGKKTVEIRKSRINACVGDTIAIYATKPKGHIVGYFSVEKVMWAETDMLWKAKGHCTCLSYDEYMKYADGKSSMCGIAISSVTPVDGMPMEQMRMHVPQSYRRITEAEFFELIKKE